MILLKELFIIAISMFKATMTVQITWAITKRWPKVEVREKSGILNRDFVFFHETKQQPEHFEEGVCVPENK